MTGPIADAARSTHLDPELPFDGWHCLSDYNLSRRINDEVADTGNRAGSSTLEDEAASIGKGDRYISTGAAVRYAGNRSGNIVQIETWGSRVDHVVQPLWKPPFVSKLAAEDRCHLNGLALRDGIPAHVTAVSEGDVTDGWRDFRRAGGCVIDIETNEVVLRGLSMPHSPRWYRGCLWLHNSGTGEFGYVDITARRFEPVCFLPGYLRGLDFIGDFAVVGLSKPRRNREFNGLVLQDRLAAKNAIPRCAIMIVDLRSGDAVHWLRMDGAVEELYDVAIIPGCRRPMAIGFMTDEIRRVLHVPELVPFESATHR